MKKITLVLGLLLATITTNAQNFYTFTKSTATYTDLVGATSMTNGVVWDVDDYGPVTMPFPIYVFGQTYNTVTFDDDFFLLENTNQTSAAYMFPVDGYIMDRNFSGTGASLSPISYKIEGTTGNRILKLEVKNAGLEGESMNSNTSTIYLNFQIWFYEIDKSIEYRYGTNNVTNLALFNEDATSTVHLSYSDDTTANGGYLSGTVANPSYAETNVDITLPNLNALPAANTMYRFALNSLAIADQEKVQFSMFPNPTTDVLNLTFETEVDKPYSVYDVLGREVLKGSIENNSETQINVSSLQQGTYILRIAGSTQKFVKN